MIPYLTPKKHVIKRQPVSVEEIPLDEKDITDQKQIPCLKVSGFPQMKCVDVLLKTTFCNRLPSKDMNALQVTLLDSGEATVDFESVDGRLGIYSCLYSAAAHDKHHKTHLGVSTMHSH